MIFSRGTPVWSDLSTFFVNVDLLLLFLKRDGFTGYVKFSTDDDLFLILIDEGDVVAGVEKDRRTGKSYGGSVDDIIEFARNREKVRITVSKLLRDTVDVFSNLYSEKCKVVRKDLHSDFARMGKLFAQMQQEGFNGYVLVDFINSEKHGLIMLDTGKIRAVVTDTIQLDADDSELAKIKSATFLLSEAKQKGAFFNVYKMD